MKEKTLKKLSLFLCSLFVLTLSVSFLILPRKTFSENENRALVKAPVTTAQNIFFGSFDTEFEGWFTDHFPLRDFWIGLKARTRKDLGFLQNNDVFFAEDDYLIRRFQTYETRTLYQNMDMISEFCESAGVTPHVMLVQTAAWADRDLLKSGSYSLDQDALLDEIEAYTGWKTVRADMNGEGYYFRTDHHWNARGAYQGYLAVCEQVLHKEPETFTFTPVSDSFRGTMYSRSGAFWYAGEEIIRMDREGLRAHVTLEDGTENDSLFFADRLDEKDQYMYYLDGNHAYERITTNVMNDRHALIIKDSYAHILVPYLAAEYRTIDLVDLRYYRSAVSELLEDGTDVWFIYSLDNFCEDPYLVFLE